MAKKLGIQYGAPPKPFMSPEKSKAQLPNYRDYFGLSAAMPTASGASADYQREYYEATQKRQEKDPTYQLNRQLFETAQKEATLSALNADAELVKRWDSLSQEQKMLMPPESRKRIESMRIRAVVLANEEMMKSRNQQQRGNSQASMSGASARSAAWRVAQNKNRPSQTGGQSSDGQQTEKHLYGGGYPIMSM